MRSVRGHDEDDVTAVKVTMATSNSLRAIGRESRATYNLLVAHKSGFNRARAFFLALFSSVSFPHAVQMD